MGIPTISTIIPIYNTSKYLHRCVDSILAQNIADIEIILVDDGSTDESPDICDEYKARYPNIITVHQPNSGVSIARNVGLKLARGRYVNFADSDDFWGAEFYDDIVSQMIKHDLEIGCASSYIQTEEGEFITKYNSDSVELLSSEEAIKELLKCDKVSYSLCDKIFSREILKGLFFRPDIYHNEDFLFCYEAIKSSKRILLKLRPYHYYCYNTGSAVNSHFNDRKATAIHAQTIVNNDIHKSFPSLDKLADAQYYKVLLYLTSQMIRSGYDNEEILIHVQRLVRDNIKRILRSSLAIGYKKNALALSCGWNILKIVSR